MTAARSRATVTVQDRLRADIAAIAARIDRSLRNPPGTAHRGLWFWLYPPSSVTSLSVLEALHADAVSALAEAVAGKKISSRGAPNPGRGGPVSLPPKASDQRK